MNVYELIALGKEELGYIEKATLDNLENKTAEPGNGKYTKYCRDIDNATLSGCNGCAWSGSFQFWLDLKIFGKDKALELWNMTASTYTGYNISSIYSVFEKCGKVKKTPSLGALVVFKRSHIGRVINFYYVNGTMYIEVLEGDSSFKRNDKTYKTVTIKRYNVNDTSIKGYCYIDYEQFNDNKSCWKYNNGWEYIITNGVNVINNWYIDKREYLYRFDKNGKALQNTWFEFMNCNYYFQDDCSAAKSKWIFYEDNWYYFTQYGVMAKNCYVKSNNKEIYYYLNDCGVCNGEIYSNIPLSAQIVS